MTKKEIQIYTSGKENPNAYVFHKIKLFDIKKIHIKKKYIVYFIVSILSITLISFLLFFNFFTFGDLYSFLGFSNGIVQRNSNFTIYYLNVGQGDCSIIICDDSVMMIDTSIANNNNRIDNALTALDIDVIDYLVITHQHEDHLGNAESIIENYSVKNIIMPAITDSHDVNSIVYNSLLCSIAKNNVNPISSYNCDKFMLGSAEIDLLSPNKFYDDLNNMSIVLKVSYGDNSFLFQGDSGKEVETQLIRDGADLSADIIKIGHHGSNTSSTYEYLSHVNPSACIISYGSKNNFNHPSPKVIERLENENIDIFLTLYHGNITVTSDGKNITLYSQKNEEIKTYF